GVGQLHHGGGAAQRRDRAERVDAGHIAHRKLGALVRVTIHSRGRGVQDTPARVDLGVERNRHVVGDVDHRVDHAVGAPVHLVVGATTEDTHHRLGITPGTRGVVVVRAGLVDGGHARQFTGVVEVFTRETGVPATRVAAVRVILGLVLAGEPARTVVVAATGRDEARVAVEAAARTGADVVQAGVTDGVATRDTVLTCGGTVLGRLSRVGDQRRETSRSAGNARQRAHGTAECQLGLTQRRAQGVVEQRGDARGRGETGHPDRVEAQRDLTGTRQQLTDEASQRERYRIAGRELLVELAGGRIGLRELLVGQETAATEHTRLDGRTGQVARADARRDTLGDTGRLQRGVASAGRVDRVDVERRHRVVVGEAVLDFVVD